MDTVQKIWTLLRKLFAPPGVLSWLRAWSVVRLTATFFVSFIVTVFLPDSAIATQICPPKYLQGPPSGDP